MMPNAIKSRGVDMTGWERKLTAPIATPIISQIPAHLTQSTVMISSLPGIATVVDGITRQFYGGPRVPTRRVILP